MMELPSLRLLAARALRLAFLCFALLLSGLLAAAESGKFQFVAGEIKVISAAGVERTPVKGDSFNTGDTIVTGTNGTAQIRMADGGLMAIRANTQLRLDQYVFNGREDGNERSLLSLVKGGFRAITGLIGNRNKENYRIVTPNATIGIRGTDHEPVVIPAGATGGFQPGTYDRVYRGATIIETEKGKLIVNPNQVGFTPSKGAVPVILPKIPDFYDVKPQQPSASKDTDTSKDSGDTAKKSDGTTTKADAVRSLSNVKSLKDADIDTTTTLRTPLDTTTKDLGTTLKSDVVNTRSTLTDKLKSDSLKSLSTDSITPIDTSSKGTTSLDSSSIQIKADTLTVPVTSTLKSTVTNTTTPLTTTAPAAAITAPVTTITAPITTVIPKTVETLTVPTTTIQKITR